MAFNSGRPYHGEAVMAGELTGTTDTDYFYFFCPECGNRHIMRVIEYGIHTEGPVTGYRREEEPKQVSDFVIVLKLYCPRCKLTDFVKIGNMGWQSGELPEPGHLMCCYHPQGDDVLNENALDSHRRPTN